MATGAGGRGDCGANAVLGEVERLSGMAVPRDAGEHCDLDEIAHRDAAIAAERIGLEHFFGALCVALHVEISCVQPQVVAAMGAARRAEATAREATLAFEFLR